MTTGPLRLAVFDVDGTLVDSQAHILAAMRHAFEAAGIAQPPREEVLGIVGLSLPVAVERLAGQASDAARAELVEGYKSAYVALRRDGEEATRSPLYPGARATLERLGRRPELLLGVATGKSRRGLDHILAAHGLERHFVTRQVADDHPSKPHPSMLLRSLEETGTEAARAVMIGDTEYDMQMGRAAGVGTIGVDWGYHDRERLVDAGAWRVVEDFAQLDAALLEYWEMDE